MKIVHTDEDGNLWTVERGLTIQEALHAMRGYALAKQRATPNDPHIVEGDGASLQVCIGVYRIATFSVEQDDKKI